MRKKYCVIGAGVAGMYFSLKAAEHADVTIVCKNGLHDSNTFMAQGGIAAALDDKDSVESHIHDTLVAGDGLCDEKAVEYILSRAPAAIHDVAAMGLAFDKTAGETFGLALEGGHTHPRIVHVRDRTGESLLQMLIRKVQAHPHIQVYTHRQAIDLYVHNNRCLGAYVGNLKTGVIHLLHADATILACGGVGAIFKVHTNSPFAAGDGIGMAHRAGVQLKNMEFVQFHPTYFYDAAGGGFLISEAVRGFGAELKTPQEHAFMKQYHPLGSLAPRDIVSRAIYTEMHMHNLAHVGLDLRGFDATVVKKRFPYIINECEKAGIDIREQMIPVVPAAHYLCGGIETNCSGQTSMQGLLALGENACTGLHGANRLASNSLLEALVTAATAAEELAAPGLPGQHNGCDTEFAGRYTNDGQADQVLAQKQKVKDIMWECVGVIRCGEQLVQAVSMLREMETELGEYITEIGLSAPLVEQMNMIQTALLIAVAAEKREESRGVHIRSDFMAKNAIAVSSHSEASKACSLFFQHADVC